MTNSFVESSVHSSEIVEYITLFIIILLSRVGYFSKITNSILISVGFCILVYYLSYFYIINQVQLLNIFKKIK